ncbi:PAS domain-containing protein [Pedobacter sp.]|uniref:PAS domain-containing protein n=1 Tax=Pedobacter sp. TaxID=1411316 RepID=UPI003D7F5B1C
MQNFDETKKLLENSNINYLIAVDMNSNYSYLNNQYSKIFERIHGSLIGKHYSITIHKDDLEICKTVSAQAFANPDKIFPAIIRKFDNKGGYVITQWEYKAMWNSEGEPAGVFCIGHDITQYMLASSELKNTKASLTKTKGTLEQIAYIQSHVIRKPLANIMGLSVLLDTMDVNPELVKIVSMIKESAEELDQVIRKMATKL